MEKPTLTPHMRAAEVAIASMLEGLERMKGESDTDLVSLEISRGLLPASARAIAEQLDLGHEREDVLSAVAISYANAIVSAVATITGWSPGDDGFHFVMTVFHNHLSGEIAHRVASVPRDAMSLCAVDDSPVRGPRMTATVEGGPRAVVTLGANDKDTASALRERMTKALAEVGVIMDEANAAPMKIGFAMGLNGFGRNVCANLEIVKVL